MHRVAFASLFVLQLASSAALAASAPLNETGRPIVLAQGWWEQEHDADRARQAYWRLPPPALNRYNRLQLRINQLTAQRDQIDAQVRSAVHDQQELLGFGRR